MNAEVPIRLPISTRSAAAAPARARLARRQRVMRRWRASPSSASRRRREEAWRFTDLRPLQRSAFPPQAGAGRRDRDGASRAVAPGRRDASPRVSSMAASRRNCRRSARCRRARGWLRPRARWPERPALVEAALAASDAAGRQPFAALNAAFFADGFVLTLDPGVVLERPVEIIHLGRAAAPCSFHLRSAVTLGAGSRARLIETFAGDGGYWTNAVAAIALADGAALNHVRIQDEGRERHPFRADTRHARPRRALRWLHPDAGRAAGAPGHLRPLSTGPTRPAASTAPSAARRSGSDDRDLRRSRGARLHHARAVQGRGRRSRARHFPGPHRGARPTRSRPTRSSSTAISCSSRRATVDTKPELEILADDVKCSHGATVGDLDEEALFYLRARGIRRDRGAPHADRGFCRRDARAGRGPRAARASGRAHAIAG